MAKSKNSPAQQQKAFALYVKTAEALYQQGDHSAAIKRLKQAAQQLPKRADVKRKLGVWLDSNHQSTAALQYLEAALKLEPKATDTLVALAHAHQNLAQADIAKDYLKRALKLHPKSPAALVGMGNLEHKQGLLSEAIDHYRGALNTRLGLAHQPSSTPPSNTFDASRAEPLLWETLNQLAHAGIHAFACFGTLLGMVRDGHLLPHDHDLDIGLPYSELAAADQCLKTHGWVNIDSPHIINTLPYYHPPTGISVDLSGFVADANGNCFEGIWLDHLASRDWRITRFPPLRLEKANSPAGEGIWALTEPTRWLTALYGDWQTPDADFDTIICAHNLCGLSLLTQCYAYLRINNHWSYGQFSKALAIIHRVRQLRPEDSLLKRLEARLTKDEVALRVES